MSDKDTARLFQEINSYYLDLKIEENNLNTTVNEATVKLATIIIQRSRLESIIDRYKQKEDAMQKKT